MEKRFRQIATGQYTFQNKDNTVFESHCIYGLDENGCVWKWQVKEKKWILLSETGRYDTD